MCTFSLVAERKHYSGIYSVPKEDKKAFSLRRRSRNGQSNLKQDVSNLDARNRANSMGTQKIEKLDMLASAQNSRGNGLCSVDCSSHAVLESTI